MSNYTIGADSQYVAIRVKDPASLVKSQGGATGALAYKIAPQTITHKVYDELQQKLSDALAQQGVAADVTVMSTPGAPRQPTELLNGAVIGALAVGAGWAVYHYFLRGMFVHGRR